MTSLKSKETLSSSSLFHRLFLGAVSKYFLKSTKQQNRWDLLLQHSSPMILSVTRWFVAKWFLLKYAWSLSHVSSISSHSLVFFSKIIPYNLAKRGWWHPVSLIPIHYIPIFLDQIKYHNEIASFTYAKHNYHFHLKYIIISLYKSTHYLFSLHSSSLIIKYSYITFIWGFILLSFHSSLLLRRLFNACQK